MYTENQKSILSVYTDSDQILEQGQPMVFDHVNLMNGRSIKFIPGTSTITLAKPGIYYIAVNAIAMPNSDGAVTMQLQRNNETVHGAKGSLTSTDIANVNNMSFTSFVEVKPSCPAIDNTTRISIRNAEDNTVYTNTNLTIIKIC